ncbi:MAG TPA: hypothetical protein VFG68_18000 [Fimbriiglobus sp.]|nr:hypothetical protein [Fimbriiglobus sp.]
MSVTDWFSPRRGASPLPVPTQSVGTRKNIGANDLKIAATALEVGAVVVTGNARDFGRVPGLIHENWAGP